MTGIDASARMLDVLREKYKNSKEKPELIHGSYLDIDLGKEIYDAVVSTFSFHHLKREAKLVLYKKIFYALKKDGIYIEGDYTVKTIKEEAGFAAEYDRINKSRDACEGSHHIDIPLWVNTQRTLLVKAGFHKVKVVKQWEKSTVFICRKDELKIK